MALKPPDIHDGTEREGAWVADITGMLDLASWQKGMRVIVRKEVPHVGTQLRITDIGLSAVRGEIWFRVTERRWLVALL